MMKRVYFLDNVVAFCSGSVPPDGTWLAIDGKAFEHSLSQPVSSEADVLGLTNLQRIFETSKSAALLSENEADADHLFALFASNFKLVEAGGGVVTSPEGEVLMIFRNGRWDLPKGKIEKGEQIEQCALREVEEECGIEGLKLGRFLTYTYHIYTLDNEWILKRTAWYAMTHSGTGELTPQAEEGISEARWVTQDNIASYIAQTYPTIRDVLRATGRTE